jgi:hypothetical protein
MFCTLLVLPEVVMVTLMRPAKNPITLATEQHIWCFTANGGEKVDAL